MNLRVRGPNGQASLQVEPDATVAQLQALIASKTNVSPAQQELLAGFPPKPLTISNPSETPVSALGLQSGDSLTIRELPASQNQQPEIPSAAAGGGEPNPSGGFSIAGMSEDEQLARAIAASLGETIPEPTPSVLPPPPPQTTSVPPLANTAPPQGTGPRIATLGNNSSNASLFEPIGDGSGNAIARRVVADDNSCLFSAVGYVTKGSRSYASQLRSLVAEAVLSDPFEWNEVVLGKEPAEYASWITDSRRWGGAIEVSILSKKFGKEIAAFDIQTQRVDVYGQDAGYSERVLLVYDGLHYDALAIASREGAAESQDVTTIPSQGAKTDAVMAAAGRLVSRFHSSRQFTDTANFTLRCGTCKIGLKGEKEAVQHAQSTGHANFTEY